MVVHMENKLINFLADKKTVRQLEKLAKKWRLNKSEVIRTAIELSTDRPDVFHKQLMEKLSGYKNGKR